MSPEARTVPILVLGWLFLRIGATAFGGIGTTLALIERELVDRRRVLTRDDVTEALTYTKLLPGSTGLQVVAYIGYKLGGWRGSALGMAGFVLAPAIEMVVLAAAYGAATTLPTIGPTVNGLTAAVIGVLLATAYRLGKANIKEPLTFAIALIAFAAGAFLSVNAALIVVAAGLLGIVRVCVPGSARERQSEATG